MFSPKTALFSAVLSFEKGILPEADAVLAFAEAFVDFGGENAEHFFLDLVVVEEQREEILILRETFYESVVNAVEVGELEILFGVVFRARTQLVGLEHEVADLEHCFDGDIVVVAFPGAAVDLGDYDGKPLLLILGKDDGGSGGQIDNGLRSHFFLAVFRLFFLDEIDGFDLPVEVETAARHADVEIGKQIAHKYKLFVQFHILET